MISEEKAMILKQKAMKWKQKARIWKQKAMFVTIRNCVFVQNILRNVEHVFNVYAKILNTCSKCKKYVTYHFSEYAYHTTKTPRTANHCTTPLHYSYNVIKKRKRHSTEVDTVTNYDLPYYIFNNIYKTYQCNKHHTPHNET